MGKSLKVLPDNGARTLQEIHDVGGGKLVASVRNADGNVAGQIQPGA